MTKLERRLTRWIALRRTCQREDCGLAVQWEWTRQIRMLVHYVRLERERLALALPYAVSMALLDADDWPEARVCVTRI